jgi:hypothetical protein
MQAAGDAVCRLREQGMSALSQQKTYAADELSHLGAAMRRTADSLHQDNDNAIASYAEAAAESIERASNYLRNSDAGRLMEDVETLARRRPEVFFGGLFIAGLVMSRFLKASRRRGDYDRSSYGDSSFNESSYGGSDLNRSSENASNFNPAPSRAYAYQESSYDQSDL